MEGSRCPRCNRESRPGATFCMFCGAPLIAQAAPSGGPSAGEAQEARVAALERQAADIHRVLVQLSDRVSRLEGGGVAPASGPVLQPEAVGAQGQAQAPAPNVVYWGPPGEGLVPVAPGAPGAAQGQGEGPPVAGGMGMDWERVLGLNWLAIIGAVALTLGVGFFLRLAFENDWIGERGRIVLGLASGAALLGAGEYTQRRYPRWAQAVTGGGLGILYLSTYASFGFYDLIPPVPAFLFLGLVVLLGGLLAIRYESLVIALLGIAGAYLTPLLLGRQLEPAERYLVVLYIILVDAGILGVSTFRNWRWFTLVGLIASYWLFVPMIAEVAPADLVRMELGLTATFLIFVGATTLFHLLWRRLPNNLDMGLMSLNALAFFGSTYLLLWDDYRPWFGFIALALSLFYGLVGYGALKRSGAPPQVALFALAIALVFLTVAAPLQLSGSWITVAWAAEGAVLVWVGFLLGTWQARAFGLGVLAIALARLLLIDTFVYLPAFRLFFNDRFPTFVVGIAAFYAAGYLYHRWRGVVQEWEGQMGLFLLGVANLLTLWILSAEAIRYFDARALAALPSPRRAYLDAENGKLLALTVLWGVYALGLLALAQARGSRYLRWAGLALLALAVGKFVLVDTLALNVDPAAFHPAFNYPFATFLVLLAVVIFAAFLVAKRRDTLLPGEAYALPVLVVAANVLAIWAFSVEAWRYFDSREYLLRTDMDSAKHLTLTVLWAIYAVGVIVVGFVARSNTIRLAGLALLAIPVVKLFAFDVFLLERGYRVAAFVTLGVLLLGTGLAYQRYSGAIRGFLFSKGSPEARDDA